MTSCIFHRNYRKVDLFIGVRLPVLDIYDVLLVRGAGRSIIGGGGGAYSYIRVLPN